MPPLVMGGKSDRLLERISPGCTRLAVYEQYIWVAPLYFDKAIVRKMPLPARLCQSFGTTNPLPVSIR